MRDVHDADYTVDKLQEEYNAARERGLNHLDALTVTSDTHGVERFKVAALVTSPEDRERVFLARARG